jgi:hypothetical protein
MPVGPATYLSPGRIIPDGCVTTKGEENDDTNFRKSITLRLVD